MSTGAFIIPRDGIVYVATGARFIQEAEVSVAQTKTVMPSVPITLFTDQHPASKLFENVIVLETPRFASADKIAGMRHSPYERTLFLDTDILVIEDMSDIFVMLDRFDVALAHDPSRKNKLMLNWDDIPYGFSQYNSGVIGLRKAQVTQDLLTDWERRYDEEKRENPRKRMLDQPALRHALYLSEARIATLPPEYNLRPSFPGYSQGRVKVLHGRTYVNQQVAQLINQSEMARAIFLEKDQVVVRVRVKDTPQKNIMQRLWKRFRKRVDGMRV